MVPAKTVELAHVNHLAHGAVWLGSIECYFALKAYGLNNQL